MIDKVDDEIFHLRFWSPLYPTSPLAIYSFIPHFRHSNSRTRQRCAEDEGDPWLGVRCREASCNSQRR